MNNKIKTLLFSLLVALPIAACGDPHTSNPSPSTGGEGPSTTHTTPQGPKIKHFQGLAIFPPHGLDCKKPGKDQVFPFVFTSLAKDRLNPTKDVTLPLTPNSVIETYGITLDPKTNLSANNILSFNTQIQPYASPYYDTTAEPDQCAATCDQPYMCHSINNDSQSIKQCTQATSFSVIPGTTQYVVKGPKSDKQLTIVIEASHYMAQLTNDLQKDIVEEQIIPLLDQMRLSPETQKIPIRIITTQDINLGPYVVSEGIASKVKNDLQKLKGTQNELKANTSLPNMTYLNIKQAIDSWKSDKKDTEKFLIVITPGPNNYYPQKPQGATLASILSDLKDNKIRTFIMQVSTPLNPSDKTYPEIDKYATGAKSCSNDNECANDEECRGLNGSATPKYCRPKFATIGKPTDTHGFTQEPSEAYAEIACETEGSFIFAHKIQEIDSYLRQMPFAFNALYTAKVHLSALPDQTKGFYKLSGSFQMPLFNGMGSANLTAPGVQDNRPVFFVNTK